MKEGQSESDISGLSVYDLPVITTARFGHMNCCTYIPFLPTHKERICCSCSNKCKNDKDQQFDGTNTTHM